MPDLCLCCREYVVTVLLKVGLLPSCLRALVVVNQDLRCSENRAVCCFR